MKAIRKAQQITVDEIAIVAATGVARALAARQVAGVELSSEELSQVSGGLTLSGDLTLRDFLGCTDGMKLSPPPLIA
jgi:hypothetical protein